MTSELVAQASPDLVQLWLDAPIGLVPTPAIQVG